MDPDARQESGRRAELLTRWAHSQARLAAWRDLIARDAAERFAARAAASTGNLGPRYTRELYDLWIDCAEEAYAAVVHTDAYCRTQAGLIDTAAELLPQNPRPAPAGLAGTAVGCSLKDPVWRRDKVVLYRYRPLPFVQAARAHPVLICFALVNRPCVLDLQPDRSLVRSLLAAGLEVYLVDWGYPDENDYNIALTDYIEKYLAGCVNHVLRAEATSQLNLIGVCQGGTLSLCYCALHAAPVANLALLATPVDFHTPDNLLSKWVRPLDMDLLTRPGNLSGAMLTSMFMALSPFRLMHQKYVALLDRLTDGPALDTFGRMERWIFDSPDQAGTAVRQFVQWLYQENRLVQGSLDLDRREVRLQKIRQPVLNIYGTQDHIVPPSATTALEAHLGSRDYTEYPVETGHIGLYVSRAGQSVPRRIASWLRERY
jgi:polyhydroxyalkanoate synthase